MNMFTIVITSAGEFDTVSRAVRRVSTVSEMLDIVKAARADEYTRAVSVMLAGRPYPV